MAKVEKDNDLIGLSWRSRVTYVKALKGSWDIWNLKNTSNKIVKQKEIDILTQYHK